MALACPPWQSFPLCAKTARMEDSFPSTRTSCPFRRAVALVLRRGQALKKTRINCSDASLRNDWPCQYAGLEPIDKKRRDWRTRYAAVFQLPFRVGDAVPSENELRITNKIPGSESERQPMDP